MEDSEEYGPALPPGMIAGGGASQKSTESSNRSKVLGPSVPGHLRSKSSDSDDLSDEGQLLVKMESDMSPEQGDSTVGPMPSEMSTEGDSAAKTADEFEKRAKRMKDKLSIKSESGDGAVKREEWMTELPPEMGKNFGLQNRQFAKGSGDAGDDKDRSVWTETPTIKKEKDSKGKKRKREEDKLSGRDQKLHQQVDDYNKSNRSESLLDMHSKKQKKKKKKEKKDKKKKREKGEDKEEKKESRRPFDREKDMKTNELDDAQRKALIKKSAVLNTRFSFGEKTSHFL